MDRNIKVKMKKQNTEITRLCKLKNDCRMFALSRMTACEVNFKNFENIDDKKREELRKEAIKLREKFKIEEGIDTQKYYKIVINITTKNNEQRMDYDKAIVLLIETLDPKLKLFRLSRKASSAFEMEVMSNRLFKFYEPKLIEFEKEYVKKFNKANVDSLVKKLEAARS